MIGSLLHRAWKYVGSAAGVAWVTLILACVGSRLATTITYIEDPDSLRFALSVADEYNIAALQPHFPGYPIFWAVSELLYVPTGTFSAAFSIVGGLATAGLVWALLRLWGVPLLSVEGLALAGTVFFCPLLWLMGNRYMPDLLGTANAMAALALLVRALDRDAASVDERTALTGVVLTGLLAGLRLSYLPLVVVPALWVLGRSEHPARLMVAGAGSVVVWLVPMILDTGAGTLIDVAWGQTTGHFTDFGGTVQTESDLGRRLVGTVQGLWADGLGGWWPGRHWSTAGVGAGLLGLGTMGARRLWASMSFRDRRVWVLAAAILLYGVWIFFFQNVVHKSRHVLPLLVLVLPVLATGAAVLWRVQSWGTRGTVLGMAGAYAAVTLVLTVQHTTPSAIAQAKQYITRQTAQSGPTRVASVPLVNTYLQAQAVDAQYLSIEDSTDRRRLRSDSLRAGRTVVVGTYASLLPRNPSRTRTFYHNPHVNRMWPEVTVYVYDH